jgi:hypothetical protein
LVVTVRPKDGTTHIQVREEFGLGGARKVILPFGVLLGAGAGALLGAVTGVGPAMVAAGAILGVPTAIAGLIRFESNTRHPQLDALAERLREIAGRAMGEGPAAR